MLRRSLGLLMAKAKVLSDVIKTNTASTTVWILSILALAVVLFLTVGTSTAGGSGVNTKNKEASKARLALRVAAQRKHTARWRVEADMWAHKRGSHVSHNVPEITHNLKREIFRTRFWARQAKIERSKSLVFLAEVRNNIRKCVRAGAPRNLCPDLIEGAKKAGKPKWAYDSDLMWLIKHESGFRPCVRNGGLIDCSYRGDRAYGLFQFLGSTWGGVGCSITPDASIQTLCGIRYISRRYGSPSGAKNFWLNNHWY